MPLRHASNPGESPRCFTRSGHRVPSTFMRKRSFLTTSLLVSAAVIACGGGRDAVAPNGGQVDGVSIAVPAGTGAAGSAAPVGACKPSSVITTASCAPRTRPPSNASSSSGCKSDAECKNGVQGRCVDNRSGVRRRAALPPAARNLFAEPPPPPPETVCTYDQCRSNADCGAKARCDCGVDQGRNACVPLDNCLRDAECGPDARCACGDPPANGPNACIPGNCRTDADCGGLSCAQGNEGKFCRTPRDTCRTHEDCASPQQFRICDYHTSSKAWTCRVIVPRPPG